jgi:hypothetical protein
MNSQFNFLFSALHFRLSLGPVIAAAVLGYSMPLLDAAVQWPTGIGGNGHWYRAVSVSQNISWTDAQATAQATLLAGQPGHLVTMTSAAENAFVYGLISADPSMWFATPPFSINGPWMGFYQDTSAPDYLEPGGGWKWITGEPVSYTNWRGGSPNDTSTLAGTDNFGRFIGLDGSTFSPFWDDHPLLSPPGTRSYIIEWSIPEPTTGLLLGLTLGAWAAAGRRQVLR